MRPVRVAGLAATSAGLALFGATVIAAAGFDRVFYKPLWMPAVALVCLGCLFMIAFLAVAHRTAPRATVEVVLAFFLLLVGLFFLLASLGDEGGARPVWLIPTVILVPGAVAVILLATLAKREAERWRNRD